MRQIAELHRLGVDAQALEVQPRQLEQLADQGLRVLRLAQRDREIAAALGLGQRC